MKRLGTLIAALAVLLALIAGPAAAKAPPEEAMGRVTITGPGVDTPIHIDSALTVFRSEDQVEGISEGGDVATLARLTGLFSDDPELGWFTVGVDPATLGPAYTLTYDMTSDSGWSASAVQQIYPFAPDGPLVVTTKDTLAQRSDHLWWVAPSALTTLLQRHGFPSSPPAVVSGRRSQNGVQPGPHPWIWAVLAIALLALIVGGAVADKRRAMVAVRRP